MNNNWVVMMEKDGNCGYSEGMSKTEALEMIKAYENNGYTLLEMFQAVSQL